MSKKPLLDAFEKAIAEYETDTYEVEFSRVMDSWDMFVTNPRMDTQAIDYAKFVGKMLKHLESAGYEIRQRQPSPSPRNQHGRETWT